MIGVPAFMETTKIILWLRNPAPHGWLKPYEIWDTASTVAGFRWPIHSRLQSCAPKTLCSKITKLGSIQWEFQDPKMEVLYHIRPYFVGIFP